MIWLAVALIIGQGLTILVLLRVMFTFGRLGETLLKTHHQNLIIRQNLATQENDFAVREALHNKEEREA